jgi:metal-responsive CopG/Arc/MetJ family transcriptional regulator
MALVRTNITIPEEVLALVDEVAGPRGRSAYIADVVAKQVRRDNARRVFRDLAGALRGSTTWGETDEEVLENLATLRQEWERPWVWEDEDAIPVGHDGPDRPRA